MKKVTIKPIPVQTVLPAETAEGWWFQQGQAADTGITVQTV